LGTTIALGPSTLDTIISAAIRCPPGFESGTSPRTIARATLSAIFQGRPTDAAMVEALALAINRATLEHACRVQENAVALAAALNLTDPYLLRAIAAGGLLHDIGKLAVPEHLLDKPGPLEPDEFDQVKRHARFGAEMLTCVNSPDVLVTIVRHHHENWNGTGYPDRLADAAIPLGARVLAIIDCYDALTSDRPYRRALSRETAVGLIEERRGTMYDPAIVDAFLAIQPDLACAMDRGEPRQESAA
jgi:putative nucleotidyltransferase with HDIG domain